MGEKLMKVHDIPKVMIMQLPACLPAFFLFFCFLLFLLFNGIHPPFPWF